MDYNKFLNEQVIENTKASLQLSILNRVNLLQDNFESAVDEEMQSQFYVKNYKRMSQMLSVENNVFRKVIYLTSKIYQAPAVRKAVTIHAGTELIDDVYTNVIALSNIDDVMPTVNRLTNACNNVMVMVRWDNGIHYDIITLNKANIYTYDTDPLKLYAVRYASGSYQYLYINDGRILKFDDTQLIDQTENPYKNGDKFVLPFVIFHRNYPYTDLLDYSSGSDLYSYTIHVNVLMTYLNYLIKMQTYKQPYIAGESVKRPPDEAWDPASIGIFEGEGIQVGILDLQSNIEALYKVIQSKTAAIVSNYNIAPENYTLTGTPSSGYALKLSNRSLDEQLVYDRQLYRKGERELFDITKIINNVHNIDKIDVKAHLDIDFAEPTYASDPKTLTDEWVTKITNNVKTTLDWLMSLNPDLSLDEAKAKLKDNEAINAEQAVTPYE